MCRSVVLQQLLADGLAGAALEQHVVGHDDGGAARGLEHRADVLHEVELLVRGGRPEILPVVGEVVGFLLALLVGEAHRAFLAEGRIGEDVVEASARSARPARRSGEISDVAVDLADVVQEHVHQAEAARVGDDLVAVKRLVLQERLLRLVELVVVRVGQEVVGGEEEAAGAAGRIGDGLARLGPHAFDHRADQRARREVLSRAGFGVLGVLLQQAFVDVALDVGAHRHPLHLVDHVDQAVELGRVLNLVLRLGENLAEHALARCPARAAASM